MIDTLAFKLATLIKKANPEETTRIEIMTYSLTIMINSVLILIESLIIGWITGKLYDTALVFLAMSLLRLFSGGLHMPTTLGCNIVTTSICVIVPHAAPFFQPWTGVLTLISLVLVIIFSPVVDKHTRVRKEKYPILKLISAIIVSSNFILHSEVIGLTFLIQSITLFPYVRRAKP